MKRRAPERAAKKRKRPTKKPASRRPAFDALAPEMYGYAWAEKGRYPGRGVFGVIEGNPMVAPHLKPGWEAGIAELWWTRCRELYERTKNPLFAWAAYEIARYGKQPVPEWVLIYFDSVLAGLRDLRWERPESMKPPEAIRAIAKALGSASPGHLFGEFENILRDDHLASEVSAAMDEGNKPYIAPHVVAEKSRERRTITFDLLPQAGKRVPLAEVTTGDQPVSESTVRRAYQRYGKK